MKLKVYGEKRKEEKPIYFKLSECNNVITLNVLDEYGNEITSSTILSIDQKGLHLHAAIDKNIGLPLDKEGRMVIQNLDGVCMSLCEACSCCET